jgi:hypothetical protein
VGLLLDREFVPHHAQIAMIDPDVEGSYPDWGDGDEEAVSSGSGVVVATQPDHVGKVRVEVITGDPAEDLRNVLDTTLSVSSDRGLVAGSVTGSDLHPVPIGTGEHRVSVYVEGPPDEVSRVVFAFPDA